VRENWLWVSLNPGSRVPGGEEGVKWPVSCRQFCRLVGGLGRNPRDIGAWRQRCRQKPDDGKTRQPAAFPEDKWDTQVSDNSERHLQKRAADGFLAVP